MEGILRGKEMDKIEKLYKKAYDLSSNIVYFPVRHHSPSCAFHLKSLIQNYNPEVVLIEGPVDANDLIPYLSNEETKAPICIYYSYTDKKKLVSEEEEKYRCYYPFLDYSPELVALRECKERGIKAEFMDLSFPEILISSEEGKGLRKGEEKNSYNDDYLFERSRFINLLCEKQGIRSFNELWEMLFEIDGLKASTDVFVKNLLSFCFLSRCLEKEERMVEEGYVAREIYMASKIKEVSSNYNRTLVVTGGFHTSGLIELMDKETKVKLHNIDKKDVGAYAMVYSFEESDQLNGYASGMPHPAFYQKVWENLSSGEERPYEKAVLDFLISSGRKIRKDGGALSIADEIGAFNMAKGLQVLREKKECGVYELKDAVRASFVKGELNMSTNAPLITLSQLLTGRKIGSLCSGAAMPPIVTNFRELCSKYKLKINNTIQQEVTLDIYKSSRHREISSFLYRMRFLESGFCTNVKGPDFINRKNVNLIRETWNYKWTVNVESSLIENSVFGGTVEEAVESLLLKRFSDNIAESGIVSLNLMEAFIMGYNNILLKALPSLKEIIIKDGSFYSLAQCTYNIFLLYDRRTSFASEEGQNIEEALLQSYNKTVTLIPELHSIPEDEENEVIRKLKDIYHITLERKLSVDEDIFKEALLSIANRDGSNSAIEGAVLGLLLGLNAVDSSYIVKKAEGYLYGTGDKFLKSAVFLKGLFSTARDIVLSEEEMLIGIDNVMKNLQEEDFLKLLPELRLSFSFFSPSEVDVIGKNLAQQYGTSERNVLDIEGIDPRELSFALELDKFGVETLSERGVLIEG